MGSKEKKRLLIMGGLAQQCDIIEDAKKKGYYVIVVDYLEESPGKKLAHESHLISITDIDAIVELCRERKVDGVMNYCIDPGQKPYQQICERLDLPCYGTKEQFDIMSNKDLFYEACIQHGVDVIPRYEISEHYGAKELEAIEFPVVVKPVDGRASKGLTICRSKESLNDAIELALSYSKRGKIIFEKHMQKPELCAKYFVCDGEVFLTAVSDTHTCYVDGKRAYIIGKSYPSKYYKEFEETTDPKVRNMIRNLGIQNGPLSFTGFYDAGTFRFFDPSFSDGGRSGMAYDCGHHGHQYIATYDEFCINWFYGRSGNAERIR